MEYFVMWGIFWFAVFLWVLLYLFHIEKKEKDMYVYIYSAGVYVVGHYEPLTHKFIAESDWPTAQDAAEHVHYLNGGN